jgi:hypothetical protein
MSLDCDYEDIYERPKRDVISYILQVGESRQILTELSRHEIFDTLSKHNEYWDSEHVIEAEKLDDARCKLKYIFERLNEVLEKLE